MQVSLRLVVFGPFLTGPSSSKYAEPDAEGVTPVLRTGRACPRQYAHFYQTGLRDPHHLHVFRMVLEVLVNLRDEGEVSNMGGAVAPIGPFMRLRSAMVL